MKIENLKVQNFRGIKRVELSALGTMVIVAGTNGSGKSSIFDAVRLLKSIYGGYQPNEWHQWMGEFQIAMTQAGANISSILNDKTKPFEIEAKFRLSQEEKTFLLVNAEQLVRESVWRVVAPEMQGWQSFMAAPMAAQIRAKEPEVLALVNQQLPVLRSELAQDLIITRIFFEPGGNVQVAPSKAMELIFSTYRPGIVGLIDYHGPQRFFQRETVQGINLNLAAQKQQQAQNALYNYGAKYTNVKTEMAGSYVQEILAEQAGVLREEQNTLTRTLKELFATFFPEKTFSGPVPQPDGSLSFPVTMPDGAEHDLDDLSAGEKEVLYGYLRIRNSAPKHSIILLDEPELHLNPKLVRSLPSFYRQYLGSALDNQIWLVTHSDALLREVVARPEFAVFHMMPSTSLDFSANQAKELLVGEDAERVIIDLVGDLAAYRPGGKVVIFEGGGESEFDLLMTSRLFPDFAQVTNGISAGGKTRVRNLHAVLDAAASDSKIPFKIYSIADRDTDATAMVSATRLTWDSYHIENYLLDADVILHVLKSLMISGFDDVATVEVAIANAARLAIPSVVRALMTSYVGDTMVHSVDLRFDPNSVDVAKLIGAAAKRSFDRISAVMNDKLSDSALEAKEFAFKTQFDSDMTSGNWRKTLPGREIIKRFVADHVGIGHIPFRNLILNRMADQKVRPSGMADQLDKILSD